MTIVMHYIRKGVIAHWLIFKGAVNAIVIVGINYNVYGSNSMQL